MKSFKIAQKYFIAVALIYKYSKVSKTYLFAIFGFIDLKLLQIYSNFHLNFEYFILSQIWILSDPKYSTCQELSKYIKIIRFGVVVKKL